MLCIKGTPSTLPQLGAIQNKIKSGVPGFRYLPCYPGDTGELETEGPEKNLSRGLMVGLQIPLDAVKGQVAPKSQVQEERRRESAQTVSPRPCEDKADGLLGLSPPRGAVS